MPLIWKEAIVVPVLKKGKDKTRAGSYLPVSLTCFMGKVTERLINTRRMWHLETKGLINPEQAVFRQDRYTEDQITYLTQEIEDAFQEKEHTLAVWTDMEQALDKV